MDKLFNDFSFGLFFWQAIILLILIFVLGKFAWKPIVDALEARENGIQDALDAAEKARKDMLNLKVDNERLLAEARAERDVMLKEAREIKEKLIEDAKAEAQVQGQKLIEQAKVSIQAEKTAAMSEIKNHVSSLSLDIAEKLLRGELADKSAQENLVEKMLGDIKLN
ncbi:MAG: F0F1 ATP synthase subunit B [Flavobacterium sp.]|nr:F0F1 ATP synthase subunit B [Candidatus Neoflavobacterium equi]